MKKSESKANKKKLNEIDIDNLIKFVYNRVAEWHNDDASSQGLKHASRDVIKECINHTLKQIGMTEVDSEVIIDTGNLKD